MKREQRKAMAIKALSSTNSVTEAASLVGCSRRTIYNYLRDPGFRRELERAFDGIITEQFFAIEDQKRKAETVLAGLLDDPSAEIRLKAAKVVLDNARKREISMLGLFARGREQEDKDPLGLFT